MRGATLIYGVFLFFLLSNAGRQVRRTDRVETIQQPAAANPTNIPAETALL
jgi:hypothetical protein